jgi:hypothetical protein
MLLFIHDSDNPDFPGCQADGFLLSCCLFFNYPVYAYKRITFASDEAAI